MTRHLLPVSVCLLAASGAAQQFRLGLPRDVLGQTPHAARGEPVAADLDGDGLPELILGEGHFFAPAPPTFVYQNLLTSFAPVDSTGLPSPGGAAPVPFDADGDGDLDLAICYGAFKLLRNDGGLTLVDVSAAQMPPVTAVGGARAADVDGDGDLDLLTPWADVLINDGAGTFADETAARVTGTGFPIDERMAVADFDNDGDVDFVVMTGLFRNDGQGFFTLDPTANVQHGYGNPPFASDLDLDGDVDVLLSDGRLFENDGAGSFTDVGAIMPSGTSSVLWVRGVGDLNGDGADDVVLRTSFQVSIFSYEPRWVPNDGAGGFDPTTEVPLPTATQFASHVGIDDLDGDGDRDLVVVDAFSYVPHPAEVLYNDGAGAFTNATAAGGVETPRSFGRFAADVDGDLDEDLVVGNAIYRNEGGELREYRMPFGAHGIAAADLDGDGDVDLIGRQRTWRNDGDGVFSAWQNVAVTDAIRHVAVLDADGDQDADFLMVTLSGSAGLMSNDGAGAFAWTPFAGVGITYPGSTTGLAAADLDGDGDDDVLVGATVTGSSSAYMFRNVGAGQFVAAVMPASPFGVAGFTLADVEGDGDLDFVTHSSNVPALFVNDGTGQFTTSALTGLSGYRITADDVDLDGDADLWVAAAGWRAVAVNDGSNQFTIDPARVAPETGGYAVADLALIDLDLDGDRDVVLAPENPNNSFQWHVTLWNHRRHLRAPHVTRTGDALALFVSAIDALPAPTAAFVAVSTTPLRAPVGDLGVLGLDPFAAAVWAVPLAAGEAQTSLPIPNQPLLHGLPLHAQALLVSPTTLRLTGAVESVIVH